MSKVVVRLRENGPIQLVALDDDLAALLLGRQLVAVEPHGHGIFRLIPGSRVGTIRIADRDRSLEIQVRPKVSIARLMFLLGYAANPGWHESEIEFDQADDLLPAVLDALARAATCTLQRGVLQGYRSVNDALPVLRGRVQAGAQLSRRFGLPLPVEVRYDEYDADIAENQILRAACRLGLTVPGLRPETRTQLLHIAAQLDGVSALPQGAPRPAWRPSRLNQRYVNVLRLAELILDHLSIEGTEQEKRLVAAGFTVSMWKVFEDFVTTALTEALTDLPGRTRTQFEINLDVDGLVPMRPDLVQLHRGRPVLVVDAKYKAERSDGYPNADAYQLLAYCTALRLKRGHLIYAKGNEEPREYSIRSTDLIIQAHALDLSGTPLQLKAAVRELAVRLTDTSSFDRTEEAANAQS